MIGPITGIGLGVQAIAGLIGEAFAQADEAKQRELLQQSVDEFGNIDLPKLQQLVAEQLGPSAMEGVQYDQGADAAERDALSGLDEVIQGGGFAQTDRAAINDIGNSLARRARAGRDSITQGMQARGSGGGGQETAALLAANQDASERLSETGENQAAEALRRRFSAIQAKGQLGGQMGSAKFQRDAKKAEARDAISRINAQYRTNANQYNAGLPQQAFANAMAKTSARANARAGVANSYTDKAAGTRGVAAGIGNAAAQGGIGLDRLLEEEEKRKNGGK